MSGVWFDLISTQVAGASYRATRKQLNAMKHDDPLVLVRESDNEHDTNAIKVLWNGQHVGYIPRVQAAWMSRLIDYGGYDLVARVDSVQLASFFIGITVQAPVSANDL